MAALALPAAAQTAPVSSGVQTRFLLSDAKSRSIGPEHLTGDPASLTRIIGDGTYLPLHDDLSSVACWDQAEPHAPFPSLPTEAAMTDTPKPAAP